MTRSADRNGHPSLARGARQGWQPTELSPAAANKLSLIRNRNVPWFEYSYFRF
jgi:hypothetical protein